MDNPAGLVVILHDITERKRIEQALRVSEAVPLTVFETAQDAIFIKDIDLKYTHANPAMLKILDLPQFEVLGKTDQEISVKDLPIT